MAAAEGGAGEEEGQGSGSGDAEGEEAQRGGRLEAAAYFRTYRLMRLAGFRRRGRSMIG